MAKSRRLTTSRSELYLGTYGFNPGRHQSTNGSSSPELDEDEVWSTVHDEAANGHFSSSHGGGEWTPRTSYGTTFEDARRRPPRRSESSVASSRHRQVGGLSLAFEDGAGSPGIVHQIQNNGGGAEDSPRGRHMATSAPVNVPYWSRIHRVEAEANGFDDDDDGISRQEEAEIVPPHEYLARSRGTAAFEGSMGLSLKGRKLNRVRDAVWSQTGFYG